MKTAKFLALAGAALMVLAIGNAFFNGDAGAELDTLLSIPWGITSLVDLYVGFSLFSGWILFREASWLKAALWVIAMMVFGFLTGAVYTFLALQKSKGDWQAFWMGARA